LELSEKEIRRFNMPRFLNTEQRIKVIQMLVLKKLLFNTIADWGKQKYSKTMLKYLRSSDTFLDKAIDELLVEIGSFESSKLVGIANETIVRFETKKSKTGKITNVKTVVNAPIKTIEDSDTVFDIMEAVIEQHCKKCNGKKEHCNIRDNFMLPWEAPPVNEYVTDLKEQCPYNYDSDVLIEKEA
jgi:CBS domain-containing protein